MVITQTYTVHADVRTFSVKLTSERNGYYARVCEIFNGDKEHGKPIKFTDPPRHEISARQFYQDRRSYRNHLLDEIHDRLAVWQVVRVAQDIELSRDLAPYWKACDDESEHGLFTPVDDDLSDWEQIMPGNVKILR